MKSEPIPDGSVWFSALRLHPFHRRKGVGEALTSFAIELARKNNSKYVRLIIEPTNSASMNLASKFGFHRMEEYRFFQEPLTLPVSKGWTFQVTLTSTWDGVSPSFRIAEESVGEFFGNAEFVVFERNGPLEQRDQTVIL